MVRQGWAWPQGGFSQGRGGISEPCVERRGGWPGRSASARNSKSELRLAPNGNYQAGSGLPCRRRPWTQGRAKWASTRLKRVVRLRQDSPSRSSDCPCSQRLESQECDLRRLRGCGARLWQIGWLAKCRFFAPRPASLGLARLAASEMQRQIV